MYALGVDEVRPVAVDEQVALAGPVRSQKRSKAKRKKKRSSEVSSASTSARDQTLLPAHPHDTYAPSYIHPGQPESHYSTNPPSAAAGVDISWAIPPQADASPAEWLGYNQPLTAYGSVGVEGLGLGLGGWSVGLDRGQPWEDVALAHELRVSYQQAYQVRSLADLARCQTPDRSVPFLSCAAERCRARRRPVIDRSLARSHIQLVRLTSDTGLGGRD